MKFRPFRHDGETYDLSHLDNFELELTQPAKNELPERTYSFTVEFSLHCFTRSVEDCDPAFIRYSDNRETRSFCFDRYRYSKYLPDIVREIQTKHCSHTGKGNFFFVEMVSPEGATLEYEVYFKVSKMQRGSPTQLKLFIQSAYVRSAESLPYRHAKKRIGFFVIAKNRLEGKPIKTPR